MNITRPHILRAGIAAALFASASALVAAPAITRLTPPSALFTFADPSPPYIARFITGQRFDLQCTVQPSAGSVTSVVFKVDGNPVVGTVTLTTTGLVGGLAANSAAGAYAWCYADYDARLFDRPPLDNAVRERTFGIVRADGSEKNDLFLARGP